VKLLLRSADVAADGTHQASMTLKAAIQATVRRAATTGRDGAPPIPLVFDYFPLPGFTEARNIGQKGP
jgi:hypothetical protein